MAGAKRVTHCAYRKNQMAEERKDLDDKTLHLIAQAIDGDQEAIADLYRLYESRLKAAVKAKLGKKLRSRMETVDLVQSVWKDVLPDIKDFEYRGPDSFFRWLSAHIINKIHDRAKYFGAEKRNVQKERRIRGKAMEALAISR